MRKYVIFGNAENSHVIKWVKALVVHYEVFVISSKSSHQDIVSLLPDDHIFNLGLEVSSDGGNYQLMLKYREVKRILKKIQPHYVNAHYITSHGFLAALIKGWSGLNFILIQSAWGSDILVTPFKNKMYNRITRYALDKADLITSDSNFMTKVIGELSSVQTTTFSFGLDKLPEYNPGEKEEFLFFSNRMLEENYRIDELIRFFKRIEVHQEDARLIISHEGKQKKALEEQVRALKLESKIQFKGFVSEKEQAQLYRKARFYISIPYSDATSVSLLEAMAFGCIPIVSDIPANHEWINEGQNGIFYRKGETGFESIQECLANSESMVSENRAIIQKHAIFPDSIKKFVDLLNTIHE